MTAFALAYGRLSANLRGALWMLASALTFTLMTTLIKYLGADYPPGLQTFYRQAAGLVVMAPIILRNPAAAFHTTRPVVLGLRSLGGVTALVLAFYAYQHLPLAEANALSFTRTLWIVPLAAFVLREQVGPWRIGAAMVGFAGVLVMLHPSGGGSLSLPTLSALASAGLLAATVTGMKVMTRDHSVTALMAWAAVLGFALTIPLAILDWRWPAPFDLLLLCLMGVLGLANQALYMKGISIGDAAAMAPIDYTRLVFAIMIGFAFFHEVPSLVTMTGAAIVIVSTLVITFREARLKKLPPPPVD